MQPRNFAWSWTTLSAWRACPKRYYHNKVAKDFPEEEGPALQWGKTFHKAMEDRITKGKKLIPGLDQYEKWPAEVAKYECDVECEMALNKDFKPVAWFADDTWLRAKVDVRLINHNTGVGMALDWKTGKIHPEMEQLAITAQMMFSYYPELTTVHTAFIWSKYDDETVKTYKREDLSIGLWSRLLPELRRMENDYMNLNFPAKPGSFCRAWCNVTSCPHNGRGR